MRLSRMVVAMLGMSAIYAEPTRRSASNWDSILWSAPSQSSNNKPNQTSQAKRRKYKRQGRG